MGEQIAGASKMQLWLIIGITIVVFMGGLLIMPGNEAQRSRLLAFLGTSNRGTLLQPALPLTQLPATQGKLSWQWQGQQGKWRLVLPIANGCFQACKDKLYMSRQVHIRLDKNAHRVERVLLNLGPTLDEGTLNFLSREHPHLQLVETEEEGFARLLSTASGDRSGEESRLYIVDPRGNMMMFYTPENDGKDILGDLHHLLKYSPSK